MSELRRMGVRLTAEGVNQYKEDLRSAGREARLMSQETRLAMAELGTGASSTERLTTRLKGLGREYNVQEQRVKTLTNSQKEFQTSLNLVGREIKTTSSQLKDSQRETNRLENNYRKMGEALGWNAEETKKAKAEWEASKNETKQLANSLSDLEREQSQYTKELNKMPGQINSAKIAMQEKANEMARLREEYIKNGGALGDYADKVQETSQKVRTFSEGVASVGDRLTTGVTLPIVAGVTSVVKAASDWESAFAGTRKTVDEVVDANGDVIYSYERLEDELRGLAKQLPATHDEIAEVAEAAGQLGIETENVISFTRTMIDMGESTNLSAEQAASSLARLANITGMSQYDFDRLGSSVVALGNNFATTEAEIVEMGLRLSGTGNQIGMTEADIMGLAAAMSSVGIQAEAGGTAMSTLLKRMQNVVATHKNVNEQLEEAKKVLDPKEFEKFRNEIAESEHKLAVFADQAQMSAEQFAKAFEEDPARALQAFVEGLEVSSNEGENLNEILGQLGITGIREADTLLRLAGNSEILGSALDMSATGWEENSALAEEAGVRYETLESQMGMLRNEVYDIAIEFGGPFVQALRDAMQAARPMLENVSDLAQAFSDLDEEQQQSIIRLIGITAAAGPALSILGRVGQGAANAGDGFAWLIRKVGGLQASAQTAEPIIRNTGSTIADLGPIATTAAGSKGVGGLVTAVGTSLPWALGIAAAAAGGWAVWKLWGEEAWEAGQRTRRWGADVDETTAGVLEEIQEVQGTFGLMTQGVGTSSTEMVGNFQTIGQSIEEDINSRLQAMEDYLEAMPENLRNAQQEILADEQERLEKSKEQIVQNNEEILRVQQEASNESREISTAEVAYINELHKSSLDEYLGVLNISIEEEQNIRAALSGDIENIQTEQVNNMIRLLMDEQNALDEQKNKQLRANEELAGGNKKMLEQLNKNTEDYYKAIGTTGERTLQDLLGLNEDYIYMYDLYTGELLAFDQQNYDTRVQMNKDLVASWVESHNDIGKSSQELAEVQSWMVDGTKRGAQQWNRIVMESAGSFETFREKVIEAAQTQEGWNQLKFRIHDADLDSNAKAVILEAAIMNGEWDNLEWGSKMALLKDNFSLTIYQALERLEWWNEADTETKSAVLLNEYSDTVIQALIDIGTWDNLDPDTQKLIATTNSPETLRQILEDMGVWDALPIKVKRLLADNKPAINEIEEAERKLDEYGNIIVDTPLLGADGSPARAEVEATQRRINSLTGTSVDIVTRNITEYITTTSNHNPRNGYRPLANATGTNYFEGGLTWLGDGGKREPYLTPDGEFGVSGSSNEIYDLPRGTRIWPTRQAFKTSARSNPEYRKFIDYLPKFAKGGTIRNPYEGYTALVGEAGPEIFQVAKGDVSITPITQGQRTKVLEQQGANNNNNLSNELMMKMIEGQERMIQLIAQGGDVNIDGRQVGRTIFPYIDEEFVRAFDRRSRGLSV